jgi:hypothetical protein
MFRETTGYPFKAVPIEHAELTIKSNELYQMIQPWKKFNTGNLRQTITTDNFLLELTYQRLKINP